MAILVITGELGCHSEDTLVLTPEGLKNYKEIRVGDKVLAVDKNFNIVESRVKRIFEYPYEGLMFHFKSKRYDFLVTPNHRMIFRKIWKKNYEYIEANKLKEGYFPSQFKWNGKNQDTFDFSNFQRKGVRNKTPPLNTDDFLKLLGWYISEGSLFKTKNKKAVYFQIRNLKFTEEIKELLNRMKLKYGFYENSKFIIFHDDLARYFKEKVGEKCYNKKIPKEVLELSKKHLINLFDTLWKGDGSYNHTYYTTSKDLMNSFIILCLKLGFQPRVTTRKKRDGIIEGRKIKGKRKVYEIHVSFKPKNYFSPYPNKNWKNEKNVEVVNYKGKVWCFETEHGNFFTMRNGKVGLSGNSGKTLSLTYLCWRNWYYKNKIIYANYTLYGIPYYKVTRVSELDTIRNGYCGFDEIWVWLEASVGERLKKKIISDILRKSRKRNLTIASTSQTMDQIPPRIRKIVDFIGYPILNRTKTICKLLIFSGPQGRSLLREHYFLTKPVFEMYNSILPKTKVYIFNDNNLHIKQVEKINSENLQTICFNPKTYKLEIRPVDAFIKHYVNKDCYEIVTQRNRKIKVTGDHSIFAWISPWKCKGSSRLRKGCLKPVPVRELKVGDWIAIPTKLPVVEKDIKRFNIIDFIKNDNIRIKFEGIEKIIDEQKRKIKKILLLNKEKNCYKKKSIKDILPIIRKGYLPLKVIKKLKVSIPENAKITLRYNKCSINSTIKCDTNFLWLLGFLFAEGSIYRTGVSFCSEKHLLNKAKKIAKKVFGVDFKLYEYNEKAPQLKCDNTILSLFLRKITKNTDWIIQLPLSKIKYFLYGWWQGDGYHNGKYNQIVFVTQNKKYKDFLLDLMLRFGIVASVVEVKRKVVILFGKKYYYPEGITIYRIIVPRVNLNILEWDKFPNQKLKQKRIGDLALVKIKKIRKFNYNGYVYDFSIKGYENFIANGICCHNTNEEVGDLIDDVTPTWKKAISPTAQKKYLEEFVGAQHEAKTNLQKVELVPIKNVNLPKLQLNPEIKVKMEKKELTLEDAENEKFWKDEEKAIEEALKEKMEEN